MSFEPNYKATLVILNDIEKQGLIQFNKEYHDERFFNNFIQFRKVFSHSMSELINKIDTFETKNEEITEFALYSELSFINSHLDSIKKFLKIIINPIKLDEGFGRNTTLEQMIERICKKMNYNKKLEYSIRGLFLLEFREAVKQQEYLIEKTGHIVIYPYDEKMRKHLNIKDLADYASQSMEILAAMFDWSNGKIRKVEKAEVLDDIVSDLTRQVQQLDKKLDKLS